MNHLYLVQYDNQNYYVEARTLHHAIETWKEHVKALWGQEYEGNEEPESVALVHDDPVVRSAATNLPIEAEDAIWQAYRLIEQAIYSEDGLGINGSDGEHVLPILRKHLNTDHIAELDRETVVREATPET